VCNQQEFQRPQLRPDSPVKYPSLYLYMPATPPLTFLAKAEFCLKIFRRRYHFRRLFVPLLREENSVLSDTGIIRTDIEWALKLPLKVDALKALEICRKARYEHEIIQKDVKIQHQRNKD